MQREEAGTENEGLWQTWRRKNEKKSWFTVPTANRFEALGSHEEPDPEVSNFGKSEVQVVKSESKGPWQFKPHREEPPKEGGEEAFQKWKDKLREDKKKEGYDFAGSTDLNKWIAWNFRRVEQAHASRAYENNVATTIKPCKRRQLLFDT